MWWRVELESGKESAAQPHESGKESAAQPHESGKESAVQPHESGKESAAQPHESGKESAVQLKTLLVKGFGLSRILVVMLLAGVVLASCATLMRSDDGLPQSYEGLSVAELVDLVRQHGGKALRPVYRQLQRDKSLVAAGRQIATAVPRALQGGDIVALVAMLHLYQLTADPDATRIFTLLTVPEQQQEVLVQVGWQIATLMPSPRMAATITRALERALQQGRERTLLFPQVAAAIAANRVVEGYTFLRQGLQRTHNEAFARALLKLNPQRASEDFLVYLANLSFDTLRQKLPMASNIPLHLMMLQHLRVYPVTMQHHNLDTLFSYVVSRNPALSEAAQQVLAAYYDKHSEQLAQMLARMPYWVQFACVEKLARRLNPSSRRFLVILRQKTSGVDVVDEINQLIR